MAERRCRCILKHQWQEQALISSCAGCRGCARSSYLRSNGQDDDQDKDRSKRSHDQMSFSVALFILHRRWKRSGNVARDLPPVSATRACKEIWFDRCVQCTRTTLGKAREG